MKRKILKKVIEYLITFFCIITLNFIIPRLMPGDPFTFLSSEEGDVTVTYSEEQIEKYKEYYGLDKPINKQYKDYIAKMIQGNIGYSIYFNQDVLTIIMNRVAWTLPIVFISIVLSCLIGIFLGCISAWHHNGYTDKILYFFMIVFSEIPSFLIGILFLFILAAKLDLFPLSGGASVFANYDNYFSKVKDIVHHAFLPVLTLVLSRIGGFYLLSRNSMISVLSKDYIKTAKAKGLSNALILFKHSLKNAMLPIVTRFFLSLSTIFGGAVLVENVFHYPGVGHLMKEAIMVRDYPLIQGIFLFITITVLTMNLFADIVYKKMDPRVN